ncbi:putative RNA-directed DNA polymerase [Helianthus annuus]|nr:putative RNA-directed DNA polymerase [Helianthus annuus]
MKAFYADKGIVLETSCPHTPQQNGVAERKHRHILEVARALRFEANLPVKFWGECILTAVYIINRIPLTTLKNKTPYEALLGIAPTYDHMRVFGCLTYHWNYDTKGDKFEPRGRRGIFLGYPFGTKGYKIYDLDEKKVVITRHVKFFETHFPFETEKLNKTPQVYEEKKNIEDDWLRGEVHSEEKGDEIEIGGAGQHVEIRGVDQHVEHDLGPHDIEVVDPADDNQNDSAQLQTSPPQTATTRVPRTRIQPQRYKDYSVQLPPSIDHANPILEQASSTDPKWREAMEQEIKALQENGTWTLKKLPSGKKAIDSKWVYKVKHKPDGQVDRYKARPVAKGYTQMEGVDYHDTFAPVAKLVTMRTLLALAVKQDWIIHQLDVNNAFLHDDLDEEV